MWIIEAFLSALFAGFTAVLSKIGVRNVASNLATAIRTTIVLLFSWLIVILFHDLKRLSDLTLQNYLFIISSGVISGISWLFYFKALKLGNVNKVTPIDKSNVILTMILGFIFLNEEINIYIIIGMIILAIGVYLMVAKKNDATFHNEESDNRKKAHSWFFYAILSAVTASIANILAKGSFITSSPDIEISSNLVTALRTSVILVITWLFTFAKKEYRDIKSIDKKSWLFLFLSALSTGISWLFYFKALSVGNASIVVPIDKLSVVVTITLSYLILKEKINKREFLGLIFIIIGTLLLIVDKIIPLLS